MAGPWFTVQKIPQTVWSTLDRIWLSNGHESLGAKVQIRLRLDAGPGVAAGELAALGAPQTAYRNEERNR